MMRFLLAIQFGLENAGVFLALFEQYNFAGKTIVLSCTYGGDGGSEPQSRATFRNSVDEIKLLSPQSTVRDGISIRGVNAASAGNEISAWLAALEW
jgi:hypothetical protein